MSLYSRHDIRNDSAVLLAQGGNRGEDSFGKTQAIVALVAEASLPPQDGTTQGPLGPIVGGLHPRHKGKGEQCWPELQEIATPSLSFGISTTGALTQQFSQTQAHRHQFPPHLRPGELARLITMPDGKETFYLSQPPGPHGTGSGFPFGQCLKISLQMRPANLTLATSNDVIGTPAIAMENALEGFADKLQQRFAASGARNLEDGRPSGYCHPQPTTFGLFLPTSFIYKGHVCLSHRLLGFLVGDGQSLGGLFAQTLDAAQANIHPAQLPQQLNYLSATLTEATGEDGHPGLQPGSKGASANLGRQLRFHPGLTMGTPACQQSVFDNDRMNFRQFPDLMSFYGRSLPGRPVLQSTAAVRTGFCPMLHDLIHFLRRRQLPMVSLVSGLTTWIAPAFFPSVFRSLRRVLRGRLRRIAGMAIKPGLQLVDSLLQLGNFGQSLAQCLLPYQDVSRNLWRKLFPNFWSKRSCFHKTVINTLFTKVQE